MPIAPADHLTSFLYVQAGSFARNIDNTAMLALMSVLGDRFARWLPPNFCVQLAPDNRNVEWCNVCMMHKELRLFLSPVMRNSIPMSFVFKMHVKFCGPESFYARQSNGGSAVVDTEDELKSLLLMMRSKFLYLRRLVVQCYSIEADVRPFRSALLAALQPSLTHVTLSALAGSIDARDIRTLAALPHLYELRLLGECGGGLSVINDGIDELFRPSKPDPAKQQLFFPKLRRLAATIGGVRGFGACSFRRSFRAASESAILQQLWEFDVRIRRSDYRGDSEVLSSMLNDALPSFSHIRQLGDSFCGSQLQIKGAEPLDVSPLRNLRHFGTHFLAEATFDSVLLDLSPMICVEEIPDYFFTRSKIDGRLVLPPHVRKIGRCFVEGSSIAELDLSHMSLFEQVRGDLILVATVDTMLLPPLEHISSHFLSKFTGVEQVDFVAHSLKSINLDGFAARSEINRLDTTSFAGLIIGNGMEFLCQCRKLVLVDLSGFVGVQVIGNCFLSECGGLRTIGGVAALAQVRNVGANFVSFCGQLVKFDIAKMTSLRFAGENFMTATGFSVSRRGVARQIMAANNAMDQQQQRVEGSRQRRPRQDDEQEKGEDFFTRAITQPISSFFKFVRETATFQ